MITHVDLSLLPDDLREQVLAKYRVALMEPGRKLTMQEASWLYGYTYLTVRWLVARGLIKSTGSGPKRRLSHAAMRSYRNARKKAIPTRRERSRQTKLA